MTKRGTMPSVTRLSKTGCSRSAIQRSSPLWYTLHICKGGHPLHGCSVQPCVIMRPYSRQRTSKHLGA